MNTINNTLRVLKEKIALFFNDVYQIKINVDIEKTNINLRGDFTTNVSMKNCKKLNRDPMSLAQEVVSFLLENDYLINIKDIFVSTPGFINIILNDNLLLENLNTIIQEGDRFGMNKNLSNQIWVVEHTSPNPNKAMHLGHLRNNLIGMSLVNLFKMSGAEVISEAVYNDRGIAIAKVMWGFIKYMKKNNNLLSSEYEWFNHKDDWFNPSDLSIGSDLFITKCYVFGENDFKSDLDIENVIRNLVIKWEAKDYFVWALWEHVLNIAYEGINKTLRRLNNHWDKIWYEHDHYQQGKDIVNEGLSKGIFKRLDDGAVLTDLQDYNIPDTILLKRDGTSLYITQDIALTKLKKEYYKADKMIWVIGPEQSLAMKQLFAVSEQLKIGNLNDFTHISYGYVGLKDKEGNFKKMSSRDGTVVLIDDVINNVKSKIHDIIINNNKENLHNIDLLSEKMALAAVKYSMLKTNKTQDIMFDTEDSVNTNGDSGIYILYCYVRTKSILNKRDFVSSDKFNNFIIDKEGDLLKTLIMFPVIIEKSVNDLSTHYIAQYLLELCSIFNSWYNSEIILDGTDRELYKLKVVKCVNTVIRNGLSALGIDTVDHI